MKKALKIVTYFLLSIVALAILILTFHNYIISYTLTSVIKEKSEGRALFQMDDFHWDLSEGSIIIIKPELILHDSYLDESKKIKIDKVAFEKVEIDRLKIIKLIKDRDIEALYFLIDKPEFWITETGKHSKSSFHPEKLLAILNQNTNLFQSLQLKIDDIEIHYGSVKIYESEKEDHDPGALDFTIILHKFNSNADSTVKKRILFSDEILFKIKDLKRELKSGYKLHIDSAIYSSIKNNLVIGGATLFPSDSLSNKIGFAMGQLVLTEVGLQEIRGLEDLSIRAIHLSDGYFDVYQNNDKNEESNTSDSEAFDELKKIFAEFALDSVVISRFQFRHIRNHLDTIMSLENINFLMTEVKIDSGMFDDPLNKFLYDSIKLSTSNFTSDQLVPGMHFKYSGLSYSNYDRNLKISGINVFGDADLQVAQNIDISLKEIDIKGFSLKQFQKKMKQHLSIHLVDPEISASFNMDKSEQNTQSQGFEFPKHLVLDQVNVINGNLNMSVGDKAAIDVRGLYIEIDDLNFPDQLNNTFHYENISFSYNSLKGYLENDNCDFNTGALKYSKKQLAIHQIQGCLSIYANSKPVFLKSNSLLLNEFDLEGLLFNKQLNVGILKLNEPIVTGTVQMKQSKAGIDEDVNRKGKLVQLDFNIGGIEIESGEFDASIFLKDEQIELQTKYDIKIGELKANKGDSLNILLDQLAWDIRLSGSAVTYKDHELKVKSFMSDSYNSGFKVERLSVRSDSNLIDKPEKLNIKELDLPLLEFTGLDYRLFLLDDSIDFEMLKMDGLKLDIILPETKPSEVVNANLNKKIDPRKYMFIRYDKISATGAQINIEKPGDSAHSIIQLQNFNLGHQRKEITGLNLFENFFLEFESFHIGDTVSKKYLNINKGFTDSQNMSLTLEEVEGSNIAQKDSEKVQLKSSATFKSSIIEFKNIYVQEELPSKVEVGKLIIGDLDLHMQAGEKFEKDSNKPTSLNVNLEILRRFTNIIKALSIDTTEVNDISLVYKSRSDSIPKVFIVDSIAFTVNNFGIDTSMIGQTDPQFIERLSIDLRERTHITPDSLYELKIGRLNYDFPNHQISADSFYVTPRYPDSIFFRKAIYQTDMIKLFGQRIEINDINIDALLNKKIVHFGSLELKHLNIDMYRDKRYPRNPEKRPPLVREMLMNLNQKILIDSILVEDSKLTYNESVLKSEKPGEILITDIDLRGYNLTNILKENDRETVLNIHLNGKLMGQSDVNLSIYFPIYPDSTSFWLTGKTDEIEMVSLNSMTENLLGIGIQQGKGSLEIPLIIANDSIATGTVMFRYKKLKLALYSRKKDHLSTGIFSPMLNFFINDLVVRSNNPKFARKAKQGIVYFQRDPQKGIVNFAWKGILSGLISTLGVNNKDQRKERKSLRSSP